MWGAITAAVIMGGLVWIARIAAATLRERHRAEDVAELAERLGSESARTDAVIRSLEAAENHLAERMDGAEAKVASIQTAQALGPTRRR